MESVKALMAGLIDYAGLFPPAGLGMREALQNYADYRSGPDSASLGAFIVPVERLDELEAELASLALKRDAEKPWLLSLIVKENVAAATTRAESINASKSRKGIALRVTAIEMGPGLVSEVAGRGQSDITDFETVDRYIELSPTDDLERILPKLKKADARAKIRMGGTVATAFPTTAQVVRFMRACCNTGVAFKATAGLHHPVRAQYPLTYEPDSPRAQMFGFLNVFLAAAFMWNGTDDVTAARILNENVPDSFVFTEDAIGWLDLQLSTNRIAAARDSFAGSFGSCSFREPVDELALLISSAKT